MPSPLANVCRWFVQGIGIACGVAGWFARSSGAHGLPYEVAPTVARRACLRNASEAVTKSCILM